ASVLGTGMVNVDTTAVNVALPSIQTAFGIDISGVQWLVDVYLLTVTTLLLISGALGDRYGRVFITNLGAVIFIVASLLSAVSPTFSFLMVGRTLQGIGAALLAPGGLAIINATISAERQGRIIGLWTTFITTVIALGPLLGGWIVDNVSWRYIFLINVPLGLIAFTAAYLFIPESKNLETADKLLDWQGAIALVFGLGGLIFGLIEGARLGWTSPIILGAFALSMLGILLFVFIESRSPNPLLPLPFFLIRDFSGINILTIFYFMAFNGFVFFLTLNLIQVQEYTAFAVGLALLPITFSIFFLSTPVGRLSEKYGPRRMMIIGIWISTAGFIYLATLGIETVYWVSFFPAILLLGMGIGFMIVPMTLIIMQSLPQAFSGIAAGSNYAATRLGNMLSIAVFGAVMVGWFQPALIERLSLVNLPDAMQGELIGNARNLGALAQPENIPPDLLDPTQLAIKLAFIDSFRVVMWLCVGLMALSLITTVVFIEPKRKPND
ncbi:MAG: MFS transporter, partial [Chloroflexota bacterium]